MSEYQYSQQCENHHSILTDFFMGTIAVTLQLIISRLPSSVYNRSLTIRLITDQVVSDPINILDGTESTY
jgi:hypothetical protein